MLDSPGLVAALGGPRLPARFAGFGAGRRDRGRCLLRLIDAGTALRRGEATLRLLESEAGLHGRRPTREPGCSTRHAEVPAAPLGESRLLRAPLRPRPVSR